MPSWIVEIDGSSVKNTLRALKVLDREVAVGLEKEINAIGSTIVNDARNNVPEHPPNASGNTMYGWRTVAAANPDPEVRGGRGWPAWNRGTAMSSIRSRRREYVVTVQAWDAALAIYEAAGTKSKGKPGSGAAFIRNLPQLGPDRGFNRGRVLVRALQKNYRQAQASLESVVTRASEACQRKVNM